jgi:hypothetical protein
MRRRADLPLGYDHRSSMGPKILGAPLIRGWQVRYVNQYALI